ncbi:MAG: hypothetical protein QOE26_1936 [Verrucomicrobiota bacterium]
MRLRLFRNPRFLLPLAIAALILPTSVAHATTRIVSNPGDSGAGTLRDTIAASGDGDIITFSVTKINLTSGPLTITKNITISGPGPNQLEVTRASGNFGIFIINGHSIVSISGIKVTNGFGVFTQGGAISNIDGSTLTVSNCVFSGNSGASGEAGAIDSESSILTVTNCTFANNTTPQVGGAIQTSFSDTTVASCTFNGNQASGNGGAIYKSGNNPMSVTNCIFNQNSAQGFGGAIYNVCVAGATQTTTVRDSTFTGNTSSAQSGGALAGFFGGYTLDNCTFANNTASNGGGGIFNQNGALLLTNCTLANNTASQTGGGIHNQGDGNGFAGIATVTSSTFSRNAAPNGGGIYNTGTNAGNSFVQLGNTILYSTGADLGANLVNDGSGTSITSSGYNLSSDNGGGFLTAAGDQKNINPQLGALQDNGGPTKTMALLPNSPAQDQGKNFSGPTATDQRGLPRTTDLPSVPNASGGDSTDIGAVEMTVIAPLIVTTTADHDDGSCGGGDCTLREAINAANAANGINTILFVSGLSGAITLQSALPAITDSVTIVGPGARVLSVSGNTASRVFFFSSGSSAISGLTIRDGNATTVTSGNGMRGGGIFNAQNATLTLSDCTLANNHVQGASNTTVASGAGGFGDGGAICNSGNLTISRCTLAGNSAMGGSGADASGAMGANLHGGDGGTALGAAIFNDTTGTLTMSDSTVATNLATGGAAGKGQFGGNGGAATGGVFNNGMMTVTAATLSGNGATGGAGGKGGTTQGNGSIGVASGGLATGSGTSVVGDTISAVNVGNGGAGSDAGGTFSSQGYNLIGAGDASTGFNAAGDQLGTSAAPAIAKLGTLQNNFGNTDTFALLSGSPAIDAGKAFGLSTDQRGLNRLVGTAVSGGDGSDIGAFEVQATPTPTPTPTATPIGTPTPTPGLVANVSTRLPVGTGDNVLIEGFTVQGPAGSAKKIIVRAIGPSLAAFGITDALPNPTLEIHDANNNNAIVATNDDWKVTQVGGIIAANQSAEISASGFAPGNDLESAIIANLPPGSYTAIVRGMGNSVGTGVVDAYDLSTASSASLVNVATRGLIQPGDGLMIGGFITENGLVKAVVRAIGPSLAGFGITNTLADTTLQLRDGNGAIVVENDDWKIRSSDGGSQQAEIEATGLQPIDDREAAVVTTLPPGQYTAQVRGKPETTGTGVVQVYFLP